MRKIYITFVFSIILASSLLYPGLAFGKIDLSIAETDITFSKADPLDGDLIKVYARVFNSGDSDVSGHVVFLNDGKEMAGPQPISLKPNTYDDVFINWKVKAGTYNIEAKILGLNPADDNIDNNETIKKDFFVDSDTDGDGIGNKKETDDDNDGLTDEEEVVKGTNPLVVDTDEDKVNDKIDAFPLDKNEWRDTNNDGVGDNKDPDADGDGLTNQEEIQNYGTNPLSSDSDNDGSNDDQEIKANTDPNKQDTDSDGTIDSKDNSPLDSNKAGVSLMDSVAGLLNAKNSVYLMVAAPIAILVLFLLFRKKKRRR